MTVLTRIEGVAPLKTNLPVGLGAGTNIRTPCGLRHVENLRPGDLIVTRSNGLQPLRMVWKRTICASEVAADPSLAPVLIPPRAAGPMMPQAPLRVAAAHRLLIPGYLLEGRKDCKCCLITAREFAEVCEAVKIEKSGADVVFYSLVFDAHQVFTANGLPVESFVPTETTLGALDQRQRDEIEHAVPGLLSGDVERDVAYPVWDGEGTLSIGA